MARAARRSARFSSPQTLALLAPGEGRGSRLVGAGRLVVKLRVDPHDDAYAEAWALRRLPAGVGPRLELHSTIAQVKAQAAREGAWHELRALALDGGGVLVMEALEGSHPRAPLAHAEMREVARAVARVHSVRVERGPRLRTGSSPVAMASLAGALLRELRAAALVDAATARALAGALAKASARASVARRLPRVRTLCHGDLRWHNVLFHEGAARLVDLEHAGVGDPAVDLALMALRTPLSSDEELCLLDAYLDERRDPSLLDRYFALRPLVAVLGAVAAVHDLGGVARGEHATTETAASYVARRRDFIRADVERALAVTASRRVSVRLAAEPTRRKRLGQIAVDGTASSGKSVVAARLASAHGAAYFNSGLAYRYLALLALEQRLSPRRPPDVERALASFAKSRLCLVDDGGLSAGKARVEGALFVHEIDRVVARFARLPEVRAAVGRVLAPALLVHDAVIEGRDVGSVLLPRARLCFFVDAELPVRAERTLMRLGRRLSLSSVGRCLAERDRLDRERRVAPMVPAPGAVRVDTTRSSREAVLARVLAAVEERAG